MARSRRTRRITRSAMTVLGALLLADGEVVAVEDLALWLFEKTISRECLYHHVMSLRTFGVEIATVPNGGGYRLMRVPPDEHLESMLAMLPVVRRSDWWWLRCANQEQRHTA